MDDRTISAVIDLCRCPKSGQNLRYDAATQSFLAGPNRYPVVNGVVSFLDSAGEPEPDLKAEIKEYWSEFTPTWFEYRSDLSDESLREAFRRHEQITDQLYPYQKEVFGYERVRGKRYLEVGVGQGEQFARYASNQPALAVGVDFSKKSLEITRRRLQLLGIDGLLIQADATALPFKDQSFDFVMSSGVLHHIPQIDKACGEIRRVLSVGGMCLLMVYNRGSIWYWWDVLTVNGLKAVLINKVPALARRLTGRDLTGHPLSFPDHRVSVRRVANASTELGGWRNPLSQFLTPADLRRLFGADLRYRIFSKETHSFGKARVRLADKLGWGCFLYAELTK